MDFTDERKAKLKDEFDKAATDGMLGWKQVRQRLQRCARRVRGTGGSRVARRGAMEAWEGAWGVCVVVLVLVKSVRCGAGAGGERAVRWEVWCAKPSHMPLHCSATRDTALHARAPPALASIRRMSSCAAGEEHGANGYSNSEEDPNPNPNSNPDPNPNPYPYPNP